MDELTILDPIGMLGYGIPRGSLAAAVENFDVDVIARDARYTDHGPNYPEQGAFLTDIA